MSETQSVFEDTISKSVPTQYVKSITSLEKGAEFLKSLGDFAQDFPAEVKAQAKEVSSSLLDLLKKVKGLGDKEDSISDLGIFLDSLFRNYMTSKISTKEAATIYSVATKVYEQMTNGMHKAVSNSVESGKVYTKCNKCGFVVPSYPGRYPNFCPECGNGFVKTDGIIGESFSAEDRKKILSMYKDDPLYNAVLTAKNKEEQEKAVGILKSVKGASVYNDFIKKVQSFSKNEQAIEEVLKVNKEMKKWFTDYHGYATDLQKEFQKKFGGGEKEFKTFLFQMMGEQVNEQGMSPGMQSAFNKIQYKGQCPVCGLRIPKYCGRYPKFCPGCGDNLQNAIGSPVRSLSCPRCESQGFAIKCDHCGYSTQKEATQYDSAIMEIFHFIKGKIVSITETCNFFGIEYRGNEICEEAYNKDISDLIEVAKSGKGTKEINPKLVSKLDDATLCAISPYLVDFDKLTGSKICESLSGRFLQIFPDFYAAINLVRAKALSLPEQDHNEITSFITEMYETHLTPLDYCDDTSTNYFSDMATKVLTESTLSNLRAEVRKRKDLFENIKKVSYDKLDYSRAIKAFSSCLSRVVIENDLRRIPSLDVFRSLTFEKMGNLFEGKKRSAINFLQGVFLSKEDR